MVVDGQADPYDLARFVEAQASAHDDALRELRAGRKASHWMWFVFPQIEGLGASAMSRHYAIRSMDEARAYLAHPVLGARLRECVSTVLECNTRSANEIFGYPDDMKLRSSLTLFHVAAPDEPLFGAALDRFFDGEQDGATLKRLQNDQ